MLQLRINPFYIFTDKRIMGTSQHQGVQSIVTDKIIHIILYSQIHDIIVDDPFSIRQRGTRRLEYVETAAVSSDAGLIRLAGYGHLRPDYSPILLFFCTPFGYGRWQPVLSQVLRYMWESLPQIVYTRYLPYCRRLLSSFSSTFTKSAISVENRFMVVVALEPYGVLAVSPKYIILSSGSFFINGGTQVSPPSPESKSHKVCCPFR